MRAVVATAQTEQEANEIVNEFQSRKDIQVLWSNVSNGIQITIVYEVETICKAIDQIEEGFKQVEAILYSKQKLGNKRKEKCEMIMDSTLLLIQSELEKTKQVWQIVGRSINPVRYARWNDLHDFEYKVDKTLRAVDHKHSTRNWNASDWQQYELVVNNID